MNEDVKTTGQAILDRLFRDQEFEPNTFAIPMPSTTEECQAQGLTFLNDVPNKIAGRRASSVIMDELFQTLAEDTNEELAGAQTMTSIGVDLATGPDCTARTEVTMQNESIISVNEIPSQGSLTVTLPDVQIGTSTMTSIEPEIQTEGYERLLAEVHYGAFASKHGLKQHDHLPDLPKGWNRSSVTKLSRQILGPLARTWLDGERIHIGFQKGDRKLSLGSGADYEAAFRAVFVEPVRARERLAKLTAGQDADT